MLVGARALPGEPLGGALVVGEHLRLEVELDAKRAIDQGTRVALAL